MKLLGKRIWLFVLCCCLSGVIRAQISGRVIDSDTGEPIPSANVYYESQRHVGTTTDRRGRFTLRVSGRRDTLVVSFVGYETVKRAVRAGEKRTVNVSMKSLDREWSELVVKPKRQKYSRKNNPAVELMRKVIAAKGQNDLKNNDYYRYDKYQRITFGFNNITQEFMDSGFLRRYPLLLKQVEYCPQTQTNILPLTYNETSSEHIFRKQPEAERDFVRGTNSEGLNELFATGDIVNIVLQRFFADVNIYDNSINLLERYFTSPLSESHAITFYQYYIMDTLDVEGDKCIELSFIPRNPQDFGFSGRLWVLADSSYQVKRCLVNLPVRSSVNFISNLVIEQDFATLPNGQRVLVKDNMIAELGALKKYHNMLVKRTTTYTGFDFSPIADERFEQREIPREGVPQIKGETFWAQHRTDTLTRSEASMSTMVSDMTPLPSSSVRATSWPSCVIVTSPSSATTLNSIVPVTSKDSRSGPVMSSATTAAPCTARKILMRSLQTPATARSSGWGSNWAFPPSTAIWKRSVLPKKPASTCPVKEPVPSTIRKI